ncbi:MAG: indolepyruvate ferredoxin oxidoreductase subunit alpha [Eubacteriales bacterium]|nr:4Fe-4S binding protein [Bacillota bacterium]
MAVFIVKDICKGCGMCNEVCPKGALSVQVKQAIVDESRCDECEECVFACPNGAITGGTAPLSKQTKMLERE